MPWLRRRNARGGKLKLCPRLICWRRWIGAMLRHAAQVDQFFGAHKQQLADHVWLHAQ